MKRNSNRVATKREVAAAVASLFVDACTTDKLPTPVACELALDLRCILEVVGDESIEALAERDGTCGGAS